MAIDYKDPVKNVTPRGRIRFYRGFGMDPNYSNSLYFRNKEAQDDFYASRASTTITYNNGSTDAPNMAIKSPYTRTFVIPANSAELFDYNYMQVTPEVGESGAMGKPLYMFITGVSYVNEKSVLVTAELDVIQTFMFDWHIGSQRVERMHSPIIYDRYAEELKLDEPYDISINEIFDTEVVSPSLNTAGYLLIVTDYPNRVGPLNDPYDKANLPSEADKAFWYGYSSSDFFGADALTVPSMGRECNQFIYLLVKPQSNARRAEALLLRLLNQYDHNEMMSSIKKIYAIPSLCVGSEGRFYSDISGSSTAPPTFYDENTYSIRTPGALRQRFEYSVPEHVNGYVPVDPKTYNLIRVRVSQRNGQQFILGPHEINQSKLTFVQQGICSLSPSVITTIGSSDSNTPFIPDQTGAPKSYNPPSIVMNAFPAGCVFNSDAVDAFELQFMNRQISSIFGVL